MSSARHAALLLACGCSPGFALRRMDLEEVGALLRRFPRARRRRPAPAIRLRGPVRAQRLDGPAVIETPPQPAGLTRRA